MAYFNGCLPDTTRRSPGRAGLAICGPPREDGLKRRLLPGSRHRDRQKRVVCCCRPSSVDLPLAGAGLPFRQLTLRVRQKRAPPPPINRHPGRKARSAWRAGTRAARWWRRGLTGWRPHRLRSSRRSRDPDEKARKREYFRNKYNMSPPHDLGPGLRRDERSLDRTGLISSLAAGLVAALGFGTLDPGSGLLAQLRPG